MAEYRSKPIEVEARQYCDCHPEAIIEWAGAHFIDIRTDERDPENPNEFLREKVLTIRTLKGEMVVSPGDWVIRGGAGEFYPCKPAIFEATYEPVPVVSGSTDNPTSPKAATMANALDPGIRKAAVDALYKARNDGKVMDEAAEAVVHAVLGYLHRSRVDEPAVAGSTEPATDASDEDACMEQFDGTFGGVTSAEFFCMLREGHDGPHDWPEGHEWWPGETE